MAGTLHHYGVSGASDLQTETVSALVFLPPAAQGCELVQRGEDLLPSQQHELNKLI